MTRNETSNIRNSTIIWLRDNVFQRYYGRRWKVSRLGLVLNGSDVSVILLN